MKGQLHGFCGTLWSKRTIWDTEHIDEVQKANETDGLQSLVHQAMRQNGKERSACTVSFRERLHAKREVMKARMLFPSTQKTYPDDFVSVLRTDHRALTVLKYCAGFPVSPRIKGPSVLCCVFGIPRLGVQVALCKWLNAVGSTQSYGWVSSIHPSRVHPEQLRDY